MNLTGYGCNLENAYGFVSITSTPLQLAQQVRDDVLQYAKEFIQFVDNDAPIRRLSFGLLSEANHNPGANMEQPRYEAVLKEIYSSGNFSTADMLKVILPGAAKNTRRSSSSTKLRVRVLWLEFATLTGAVPAPTYSFKDEADNSSGIWIRVTEYQRSSSR